MKKQLLRMIVISCILLLVGCGANDPSEAIPLTEEEISQCNDAFVSVVTTENGFEVSEISCFFTSFYENAEAINFAEFLRYCPVGEKLENMDSEEYASFLAAEKAENPSAENWEEVPTPVRRYSKEAVSAILKKYADITTDDLANTDGVIFLEEYDAYYNMTSDFAPSSFQCVGGEKIDNIIHLWSATDENGMRSQLTLVVVDGTYYIQSFQQVEG